jgi:hypothetical protein
MLPVVLPYNQFRMGNTSSEGSACEYTVSENAKKAKKGKIRVKKSWFWPKWVKNDQKRKKQASSNQ